MTRRTTLTLGDHEEALIRELTTELGEDRVRLAMDITWPKGAKVQVGPTASEAAVIRFLMEMGAMKVREMMLERGYEQAAEIYAEVHDAEEAAERRRRYAERVDRVTPG